MISAAWIQGRGNDGTLHHGGHEDGLAGDLPKRSPLKRHLSPPGQDLERHHEATVPCDGAAATCLMSQVREPQHRPRDV